MFKNLLSAVILISMLLAMPSAYAISTYKVCFKISPHIPDYRIKFRAEIAQGRNIASFGMPYSAEYFCSNGISGVAGEPVSVISSALDDWGRFPRLIDQKRERILPADSQLRFLYDVEEVHIGDNKQINQIVFTLEEELTTSNGKPVITKHEHIRLGEPKPEPEPGQAHYKACYKTASDAPIVKNTPFEIAIGQVDGDTKFVRNGNREMYRCTNNAPYIPGSNLWANFRVTPKPFAEHTKRELNLKLPHDSQINLLYDIQKINVNFNGEATAATVLYKEELIVPGSAPVIINNGGKGEIIQFEPGPNCNTEFKGTWVGNVGESSELEIVSRQRGYPGSPWLDGIFRIFPGGGEIKGDMITINECFINSNKKLAMKWKSWGNHNSWFMDAELFDKNRILVNSFSGRGPYWLTRKTKK